MILRWQEGLSPVEIAGLSENRIKEFFSLDHDLELSAKEIQNTLTTG